MNEYERKEFKIRQIMTTFLGLQYLLIVWGLLNFMPQWEELRFEVGRTIKDGLFILVLCTVLLLLVLGSSFSKNIFILFEALNAILGVLLGVILSFVGVIVFLLLTWHFWLYIFITSGAKKKYQINHISDYEKAEAAYRNEHQGLFHDDEEQ